MSYKEGPAAEMREDSHKSSSQESNKMQGTLIR